MDEECKHRDSISVGMSVLIALNKSSPSSEWISSKVKKIIDHEIYNEHGILVQITEMGISGNVKKILEIPNSDDGLTDEQILQTLEKIKQGSSFETTKFELKETFWYDVRKSEETGTAVKNLKLEYTVVNEICALLNTSGGHILIGVTNDGIVKGISEERDLQWMGQGKKDPDHFADMISKKLEEKYFKDMLTSKFVFVKPRIIDGKPIIVVQVKKSFKPFFVHKSGTFKDKNGFESQINFIEVFVRRETGITSVPIPEFMEFWKGENT